MHFDVIVIGGGAAGLMCAAEAGKRGRRVLLLERNAEVGRKILISGGGRCNFTNLGTGPESFLSRNPDFCRSALARYTPADFVAWVSRSGIAYHEKKLGQLFCDGSARQIVAMLTQACAAAGVRIEVGCEVGEVSAQSGGFGVQTSAGDFACDALVVASGGLSIPKLGASDFALRIAKQFGLAVAEPRPGLVPLRFEGAELDFCAALRGVSLDTRTSCAGQAFRENVLFTHRGLSGPAVLQVSSYWQPGECIEIDLLPAEDAAQCVSEARARAQDCAALLGERHPRRFAVAWAARYGPPRPLCEASKAELAELTQRLRSWRLRPSTGEGFGKAEVTVGGVDTSELSSRSLVCRRVPGLYFIGEAVDVTGWLGGYNFQWAWASGFAAGQAA
jgi:predicted Rossmann fold flavoprotein